MKKKIEKLLNIAAFEIPKDGLDDAQRENLSNLIDAFANDVFKILNNKVQRTSQKRKKLIKSKSVEESKNELLELIDTPNDVITKNIFEEDVDFFIDKSGDIELTLTQEQCLARIKFLKDYLESIDSDENNWRYWRDGDQQIVELDILIQKNIFNSEFEDKQEYNLRKYFDDVLFETNWRDPSNPKIQTDYFFKLNEQNIPGIMIWGFDVPDDFIPDLRIASNKDWSKKVYALTYPYKVVRDIIFFVNTKQMFVLKYGSRSENPIITESETFSDYFEFFDFVENCFGEENVKLEGKIGELYDEVDTKFD